VTAETVVFCWLDLSHSSGRNPWHAELQKMRQGGWHAPMIILTAVGVGGPGSGVKVRDHPWIPCLPLHVVCQEPVAGLIQQSWGTTACWIGGSGVGQAPITLPVPQLVELAF
jgi:hypothetical protein